MILDPNTKVRRYTFDCGCKFYERVINNRKRAICPRCGDGNYAVTIDINCLRCGYWVMGKTIRTGGPGKYCELCKYEIKKENNRRNAKKHRASQPKYKRSVRLKVKVKKKRGGQPKRFSTEYFPKTPRQGEVYWRKDMSTQIPYVWTGKKWAATNTEQLKKDLERNLPKRVDAFLTREYPNYERGNL